MASSKQRRRHSRWKISPGFPCKFESEGVARKGRLIDLSTAGAYIEADAAPGVGDSLSVLFRSIDFDDSGPFEREIKLPGVARHQGASSAASGFGIEFEEVSEKDLTHIQEVALLPSYQ